MASNLTSRRRSAHPAYLLPGPCPRCLAETWKRAQIAQIRAKHLQIDAWLGRARARVAREDRAVLRVPENILPPVEYVLPALPHPLATLDPLPPLPPSEADSEGERWHLAPLRPKRTMVYLWGCGRPQAPITEWQFRYTEAAARFAAEHGWDEEGWAAWAIEITLPVSVNRAVREFGALLSRDPAVMGWGMQTAREE